MLAKTTGTLRSFLVCFYQLFRFSHPVGFSSFASLNAVAATIYYALAFQNVRSAESYRTFTGRDSNPAHVAAGRIATLTIPLRQW